MITKLWDRLGRLASPARWSDAMLSVRFSRLISREARLVRLELERTYEERFRREETLRRLEQATALLKAACEHNTLPQEDITQIIRTIRAVGHLPQGRLPSEVNKFHSSPKDAIDIHTDEHLRLEWAAINGDIGNIYKVLGPPPLKTFSGVRDDR